MKNSQRLLLVCLLLFSSTPFLLFAQNPEFPPPATRTIVADVLAVEGEYIIVRGKLGEIRIEVKADTKISEEFEFGDKVRAILRPNDSAISVVRAGANEPTILQSDSPTSMPMRTEEPAQAPPTLAPPANTPPSQEEGPAAPPSTDPTTRIIVADLLMVDGDLYIVRSEFGEIQIEATPETRMTEKFDFGDRIKAQVLPNDKAIYIERAKPEDPIGIHKIEQASKLKNIPQASTQNKKTAPAPPMAKPDKPIAPKGTRTIIADVLMVDGDFIIVRGERGEIQIEVTMKTNISEQFDYGDKIKAIVLPNDRAISVHRASPNDIVGITKN